MSAVTDAGEIAVAFSRLLRGAGVSVPMSSTIAFAEALAATGVDDRDTTYWAGRATLVRRPEDHDTYDRAFKVFWEDRRPAGEEPPAEEPAHVTLAIDDDSADDGTDGPDSAEAADEETIELRFSATEVLRNKDFADYSDQELIEAQQLMTRLRLAGSPRESRRLVATGGRTARPDLRRTVRA
ncbi:MAG: vWA domain-containing protein, partial [Ilumatobacteraceae bacterium]